MLLVNQDQAKAEVKIGKAVRDFQIKKCPKTDAEILSLCTLCLCGSCLRLMYFLEVSKCDRY
jgi:hypothetical protein